MNDPVFQRVTLIGAGAIGGWLGAGLAQAGCSVSFLARGATLAALQMQGLKLQSSAQPEQTYPVRASNSAAELGVQDLVIIAAKHPPCEKSPCKLPPC